ncbi:carboxypeptidase B isoform X2 [Haematobia irritans]|uniref:carboxypeptidase B isoform X2 n=1 Tax=Haematobia irritans TaxID=7368 RepID=UPI003F4F7130
MTSNIRWNMMTLSVILAVLIIPSTHSAKTFDVTRMTPVADRNIQTGNKMLIEREIIEEHDAVNRNESNMLEGEQREHEDTQPDDGVLDVNEIPVRYDDAQLWRIYNISGAMSRRNMMPLGDILESKYGGTIWKENSKFLDVSIEKKHINRARAFLQDHNLNTEVLNYNIQDLIDAEAAIGANLTQSEMGQRTKKAARSGIHWKDYHDLETIYAFMREIRGKFPNICRLYTIGKTAEGRDLKVLSISENLSDNKKIWIDGGTHAREWISPATVTYIINQLLSNWENQPKYIRNKSWFFMPMVNPDGYVYSRRKNRLWRKNRATTKSASCIGVDLNRNFNIGWNTKGSSSNPCHDTYHGPRANSELEAQAVISFLEEISINLEAFLTFHSYSQAFVYPFGYKAAKSKYAPMLQRVGNEAARLIKNKTGKHYDVGVTYKLLSIAGGGADDWAHSVLETKYVFTVELRDRGRYGFVLPPSQIMGAALEGYIFAETVAKDMS